jgi:hypothetical protein
MDAGETDRALKIGSLLFRYFVAPVNRTEDRQHSV